MDFDRVIRVMKRTFTNLFASVTYLLFTRTGGIVFSCVVLAVIGMVFDLTKKNDISYVELKEMDLLDVLAIQSDSDVTATECLLACNENPECAMYTHHFHTSICNYYDGDAYQPNLTPTVDEEARVLLKMLREQQPVLGQDGHVYWRTLKKMTYKEAKHHCNTSSYSLAVANRNSEAAVIAKQYYFNLKKDQQSAGTGDDAGFFLEGVSQIDTTKQHPRNVEGRIVMDKQKLFYKLNSLLVTETISQIIPDSDILGYPLCQGTPFNQRTPIEYEEVDFNTITIKLPLRKVITWKQ